MQNSQQVNIRHYSFTHTHSPLMASKRLAFLVLLILCFTANLHAQNSQTIIRSGHIDSADIFKLIYVPIKVPDGITGISVKEEYSNPSKNVLNMGIFGEEGYDLGNAAGFRGWSGGAKKEFFINEADASTGYVAGPIKKGTWNILIYPSTIIREGIDWKLTITLTSGTHQTPFKTQPAKTTVNNKAGWYRGDLHMHTLHSDGKRTQQELADEAVAKHLDYIISTEHNTNSANLQWGKYDKKGLLIINGEEVTTTAYGHWNAIGLKPQTWIEWRYAPKDNAIKRYTEQVHRDGGLCIINHPFYTPTLTNGFAFNPAFFDGIEVWNGNWDALDELDLKWWNDLLKSGRRMLAIGASDTHVSSGSPNNLGTPQTVVYAKTLSQTGIINGLRQGKAYITSIPDLRLDFSAGHDEKRADIGAELIANGNVQVKISFASTLVPADAALTLIGSQGIIQSLKMTTTSSLDIDVKSTSYLRLELRDSNGQMLAMTNPIWIKTKSYRAQSCLKQ